MALTIISQDYKQYGKNYREIFFLGGMGQEHYFKFTICLHKILFNFYITATSHKHYAFTTTYHSTVLPSVNIESVSYVILMISI